MVSDNQLPVIPPTGGSPPSAVPSYQLQYFRKPFVLALVIGLLALAIRLPGLGTFMTADEENWMLRSGVFWHELFRQGDPTGTFLTTHPGVTTMWLAGAGITWQEHRLGFDIDTSNIRHLRTAAVLPVTITTALLVGVITWAAIPVIGVAAAGVGGFLLAVDPYITGMSQVVHLDTLLALLMLCGVLFFIRYLHVPSRRLLLLTALGTGAALATKFLPALWLFVTYGLILFAWSLLAPRLSSGRFIRSVKVLSSLVLLSGITIVILWPALWSQPDIFRYFRKDTTNIVSKQHVQLEESQEPISPASFYARTVLARTPPLILIVTLGALVVVGRVLASRRGRAALLARPHQPVVTIIVLLIYAIGFLILVTFVAKKSDRYALPALVALPFVAGWILSIAWQQVKALLAPLSRRVVILPGVLAVLVLGQTILWIPHTIAYHTAPLDFRSLTQQGWGEGLEEAAAWLNQHPLAEKLYVATWYPRVFSHYFTGTTMSLSSRHDDRVGFIVTYRNMGGREKDDIATAVLQELQDTEPVHTVSIGGEPYVWIYNTMGLPYFPQNTGELYGEAEVGQRIPIDHNNWDRVAIGLSTFSSRQNTQDVILHVRSDVNAHANLRTVRVNAQEIADGAYQQFSFAPIPDSAGKTYYVALTSPTSRAGDAITVRFVLTDILPGQMVWRRGSLGAGEQNEKYQRDGDIAYRID